MHRNVAAERLRLRGAGIWIPARIELPNRCQCEAKPQFANLRLHGIEGDLFPNVVITSAQYICYRRLSYDYGKSLGRFEVTGDQGFDGAYGQSCLAND